MNESPALARGGVAGIVVPPAPGHDLFEYEALAVSAARAAYADANAWHHQALGELILAYERLLRETRRLVRRSDREELEMNRLNQRLHELAQELQYRATHDALTGVLNRAAVIERARHHLEREGLALIVLDIDHFKRVNDSFGHPVGDEVIRAVADCLRSEVPAGTEVGRVGGEEFTVLLPGRDLAAAAALAERLRRRVAGHDFALPDGQPVTASFGVSSLAQGHGFDQAYGLADAALYEAKRAGRNRVACAPG